MRIDEMRSAWANAGLANRAIVIAVLLALCLMWWPMYAAWNARGTWQATLQHENGSSEPFSLRVESGGGRRATHGWARFAGSPEQRLTHLDVSRGSIRFDLMLNGQEDHFDGTIDHGRISGTWMPLASSDDLGDWSAQRISTSAY